MMEKKVVRAGAQDNDQGSGVVAAMLIGGAVVLAVWAILGQLAAALLERVA